MTEDQLNQLREALKGARQPITRTEQYAHPRGWNDCLDFVERTIKDITGEGREDAGQDEVR